MIRRLETRKRTQEVEKAAGVPENLGRDGVRLPGRQVGSSMGAVNSNEADGYAGVEHAESDEILTDRMMARELGIPLATLRYWWTIGKGPPSFKAGRYRRGLRSTFMAWCREQQQ